jgi:phage tail-like protein
MDANSTRTWQVADARGFGIGPGGGAVDLEWDMAARTLCLSRQGPVPALAEDATFALARALAPSPVCDATGRIAWWDGAAVRLGPDDGTPPPAPITLPAEDPPGVPQPSDLALDEEDILYAARNGKVVMLDLRQRFRPALVARAGFSADRLAPAPGGGVWALDRGTGRLARLSGRPLRVTGLAEPPPQGVFLPVEPNPRPPRLSLPRDARVPAGHDAMLLAASAGGLVAVLAWRLGAEAVVFLLEDGALVPRLTLEGLRHPYAMAFAGEERVAVLATDGAAPAVQAFVYDLAATPTAGGLARPVGEVHRLLAPWHGGFCNRLGAVPCYPTAGADPGVPAGLRRLHPLSGATRARSGRVLLGPFDSGQQGTVWHRLLVEASLPRGTGLRVFTHANDHGAPPSQPGEADAPAWAPHLFGDVAAPSGGGVPRAAWCDAASEVAHAAPLLGCPRVPGRAGLFDVLLQHAGRRVRRVTGRFLWLRLELEGDSLATPAVAALRVHGARFAYRDRYLPALYRETLAGPDAEAEGDATPADFLDRFLGLFEGPLTRLEDRIAGAWALTDAAAAPAPALPWLGRWIGVEAGAGADPAKLRQALLAAPHTARLHGTLGGVLAALELATGGVVIRGGRVDPAGTVPRPGQLALAQHDGVVVRALVLAVADPVGGGESAVLAGGAVTRGEIVVIEGFRLRRTFATILGADLSDLDDPLTLGLAPSGNSQVGDSLILGDAARREVAALFSAELQSLGDRAGVLSFFRRLAHRALVLVRRSARTADTARLRDVAAAAAPAHVETTFLAAARPLVVGVASLVGVDSFLAAPEPARVVRIGRTRIGEGDRLGGVGGLAPGAPPPGRGRPRAVIDGPAEIAPGSGFLLSALRSEAAPGARVDRHIWTWT